MKDITERKPIEYHIFARLGRWVYSLRLKLEELNDWVDLKAGEFLEEDW